MRKLPFGVTARDIITGLEGVISGIHESLTGCDQYVLKPQVLNEKGEPAEGVFVDVSRIEIIDDTVVMEPRDCPEQPKLGVQAKDKLTGYTGTVVANARFIDGSGQTIIVPKLEKPGAKPQSCWFNSATVEACGDEVVQLVKDEEFDFDPHEEATEAEQTVQKARSTGCSFPHPSAPQIESLPKF